MRRISPVMKKDCDRSVCQTLYDRESPFDPSFEELALRKRNAGMTQEEIDRIYEEKREKKHLHDEKLITMGNTAMIKIRSEVQCLFNEYGIDYYEIDDDRIIFIYDNAEFTIFPDNTWSETGTDNHSGYDCRYEGHPLDELRSYFDWFESAKSYCERWGIGAKGAYHAIAHIHQQY